MSFFEEIRDWIINFWDVKVHFSPYFKKISHDLDDLKTFEEVIDPEITRIYNRIKATGSRKFAKQITRYEETAFQLKEHNKRVAEINQGVCDFDYGKILANPHSFDYSTISKYVEIANLIKAFPKHDASYDKLVEGIEDVQKYYHSMVEEHDAVLEFNKLALISPSLGYVDSKHKNRLIERRQNLRNKVLGHEKTFYSWNDDSGVIEAIAKHNQLFVEENKSNPLFDSVNERSLDEEQRESVLTDESSTLIVAGAGSGKTLTICGKVKYLLKAQNVDPSDILLLSYSKKSAQDLENKASRIDERIHVGTFHKVGLEILKETRHKTFMVEDQFKAIIESYFREEMKKRPSALHDILTYYGLYLTSDRNEKKYKNVGGNV